ncbi:hypothetical protein C0J52_25894 [Blattella germanica]|nr:hypothetical protein C0J52_25894 [Blattella germanica]
MCKQGKTIPTFGPEVLNLGIQSKPAKVADVRRLLGKHYGEDWKFVPELKFYDTIMQGHRDDAEINAED